MGIITNDNRESGGALVENTTKTCHVCGAIIKYESRPVGNFLRKWRIYQRTLPDGTIQVDERAGGEFHCSYHDKVLCMWCGDIAMKRNGKCVSMEQVAEATVVALAHKIDIWTPRGQLEVEVLAKKQQRIYLV